MDYSVSDESYTNPAPDNNSSPGQLHPPFAWKVPAAKQAITNNKIKRFMPIVFSWFTK